MSRLLKRLEARRESLIEQRRKLDRTLVDLEKEIGQAAKRSMAKFQCQAYERPLVLASTKKKSHFEQSAYHYLDRLYAAVTVSVQDFITAYEIADLRLYRGKYSVKVSRAQLERHEGASGDITRLIEADPSIQADIIRILEEESLCGRVPNHKHHATESGHVCYGGHILVDLYVFFPSIILGPELTAKVNPEHASEVALIPSDCSPPEGYTFVRSGVMEFEDTTHLVRQLLAVERTRTRDNAVWAYAHGTLLGLLQEKSDMRSIEYSEYVLSPPDEPEENMFSAESDTELSVV